MELIMRALLAFGCASIIIGALQWLVNRGGQDEEKN